MPMLPTFVIIGVMKCGTTSLHAYLAEHREVCMPTKKETDFFVAERNYRRGLSWYESLFSRSAKACGEASPNYAKSWQFAGIPERMHAVLPRARLIYLVRDPVERIVSQYRHMYACGLEHRSLGAALESALAGDRHNPYLNDSQYHRNLVPFLRRYPLDRVLVLSAEDLLHERLAALRRVFEFIGVNPEFTSAAFDHQWHRTDEKFVRTKTLFNRLVPRKWLHALLRRKWNPAYRPLPPPHCELNQSQISQLMERLQPDIREFRRLTGQSFAGWCV